MTAFYIEQIRENIGRTMEGVKFFGFGVGNLPNDPSGPVHAGPLPLRTHSILTPPPRRTLGP